MKVLIPVIDNSNSKNNIADGFHNAEYACVYDSVNDSYEWVDTADIATKPGNLSIELKRKGIFTVISHSMPLMALGLFVESGLKVYKSKGYNLQENISLFNDNLLDRLTMQSVLGMPSTCNSSCSSCSSSCN